MANHVQERAPFLPDQDDDGQQDDEDICCERQPRKHSRTIKIHGVLLILQLLLFASNVGFFFILIYPTTNQIQNAPGIEKAFSPARTEVPYKVETIDVYERSPFTGEPSHEVDVAWSDLLRSTQIRVTKGEMLQMNKTSVALRDGSGYLGYPEVLHQLHCVKRMYQYRHQDYYTHLNTHTFGLPHWNHCIEVLRRGIMCNADLTINTVEWRDGEIKGVSTHPRVCKDWSKLEEWADERALYFDSRDPGTVLVGEGEEGTYGPEDLL